MIAAILSSPWGAAVGAVDAAEIQTMMCMQDGGQKPMSGVPK